MILNKHPIFALKLAGGTSLFAIYNTLYRLLIGSPEIANNYLVFVYINNMGKRILVIENDPGIKELLNIILKLEGYEVKELRHVEFSISEIVKFNPHLILMDIIQPGNLR
jgi:PleD family two-component response regulator